MSASVELDESFRTSSYGKPGSRKYRIPVSKTYKDKKSDQK